MKSKTTVAALAIAVLAAGGFLLGPHLLPDNRIPDSIDDQETPLLKKYSIDDASFPERNNVFAVPETPLAEDELLFVVEIPKGSPMKDETRTATGQLFLDRELCPRQVLKNGKLVGWVHQYPAHYGFSAGRFNTDGDPVDLLVLGSDEKYHAMILDRNIEPQRVRVIGLIKMEECEQLLDGMACTEDQHWIQDWKVLAVDAEGEYSDLIDIKDLDSETIASFDLFFSNYKDPSADLNGVLHNQTRVAGLMNKSQTLQSFIAEFDSVDAEARAARISGCQALNHDRLEKAAAFPSSPDYDPYFVSCLENVFDKTFFRSEENFSFFVNYSAYQLLYSINKKDPKKMEGITLDNAVEKMQERRDHGYLPHYRFVSFDSPSPGLGTAVFEWVKTKNRNQGCPQGTPPQHYQTRPLIDFEGLQFPPSNRQ